jgi:hypothetical protein
MTYIMNRFSIRAGRADKLLVGTGIQWAPRDGISVQKTLSSVTFWMYGLSYLQ